MCNPKELFGAELLHYRCLEAKENLPWTNIIHADGCTLPYGEDCFDFVLQFTMFTSILDTGIKPKIANEMLRVLKPAGTIIWYDVLKYHWRDPSIRNRSGVGGRNGNISVKIEYSRHIEVRLRMRGIDRELPQRIFEDASERYLDR